MYTVTGLQHFQNIQNQKSVFIKFHQPLKALLLKPLLFILMWSARIPGDFYKKEDTVLQNHLTFSANRAVISQVLKALGF